MKYSNGKKPEQCFMRQSSWYKRAGAIGVRGVLWHSTGANNPNLRRYVQPDDNAVDRAYWLAKLGVNKAQNDWNHISIEAGVHAFIGKLDDGTITTVQVGPWEKKAWGCGSGQNGSCNNGWVQFEICEDLLLDPIYFNQVYREAIELTAYICKTYGLDPHGTVKYADMNVPVILCHADSYKLGLGSNHGDVLHWFRRFGKTMDNVRNDVAALLAADQNQENNKEDDEMTEARVKELAMEAFKEYRESLRDNTAGAWSKADREWAISTGLIKGTGDIDGKPNYSWRDFCNREQLIALLHRFAQYIGKA